MHTYTYTHDFILSRIYRVAKKLISSRKEKERKITNNKITLLSTNHIYLLMLSAMKGNGLYQTFKTSQSGLRSNVLR